MADNNLNRGGSSRYSADENWDKNQGRYVDDNNFGQQSGGYNQEGDYNRYRQNSGASYGNSGYGGSTGNRDWNSQQPYGNSYQGGMSNEGGNYGGQYRQGRQNDDNQQYGGYTGSNYGNRNMHQQDDYGRNYQSGQYWQDNEHYGHKSAGTYGGSSRQDEGRWDSGIEYGTMGANLGNYKTVEGRNDWDDRYDSRYGNRGGGSRNRERGWLDKTIDKVSSWFGDDDDRSRQSGRSGSYSSGLHRGKGPKDYRRSDERIKEDVSDRLYEDDYVDASEIEVSVQGGEVILSGTVESREAKRRAEDLVESVSGVSHVQNQLRVGQIHHASNTTTGTNMNTTTGTTGKEDKGW